MQVKNILLIEGLVRVTILSVVQPPSVDRCQKAVKVASKRIAPFGETMP